MESIIAAFKQRTLQVDFLEMSLVQNKEGDRAIVYKGNGYIRQTDDVLTFRLYAVEAKNTDLFADLNRFNDVKPGAIYREEDFYTLTATASDGSTWSAKRILPECSWLGGNKDPIVHGKLSSCARGNRVTEPRALALHFFEKADIPCMIDEMTFAAHGCEFNVHKDDDSFVIRAKSELPLPEHFETRVEEALRFLLAQSVAARVLIQGGRLELVSAASSSRRTALGPPIARGSHAFLNQSWQLFGQYLGYIIHETKHPYWNPCSGYLHNALESSANSVDAWAIGLSVAVEGLAALLPLELEEQELAKLTAVQGFIVDQVSGHCEHKEFAARIRGMVNGLTSIRAIDRLTSLVRRGGTEADCVEAWKKLRNRGVHPSTQGGNDVSSIDFQRLIDELHRVNILLNHIVFYLIGYCGPYTDYATRGFPMKQYPPSAASASSSEVRGSVPMAS